ncbi:Actin filament-associated protein 1 [Bagarius yarrelli]|uniref:Actin filament-associated protein 1 n=1 Tax=Bagarius yarrelli TaxID=175774 RepID=A0A556V8W8_BAGYA|nr:Actin filament-associated protein 1 [Bagarius yarrelli]
MRNIHLLENRQVFEVVRAYPRQTLLSVDYPVFPLTFHRLAVGEESVSAQVSHYREMCCMSQVPQVDCQTMPVITYKVERAMEELVAELRVFLELLDREYLSAAVREKKLQISNILHRVLSAKESSYKTEIHSSLPAPPQMPLPEIPHPWLSYDEEEEDGKGQKMRHQWPSEEASMDLVKDARICAFLLRKKRFGQWTKLLCVIKDNKLFMELLLSGCSVTHIPKDSKKKKHELKIVHQGADALVLAVHSKEQAEEWLKVMKEVCANGNGALDSDGGVSGSSFNKAELEKKLSCDRPSSDGEPTHENGISDGKETAKGKKNSKNEQKGTVGKGAGKKITKIISLGKKKPSTDEQTSSAEEDVPTSGYLNVLSNNRWRERWCRLKDNQLLLHKDREDLKTHMASLPLRGCEVIPGLDSKHPFAFRLLRNGQEVAVLEASSSESMGRWLGVLLAETGSTTDPATLHYDYIDVETTANVIQLAKQSFCFTSKRAISPNPYLDNPLNGYARPSGVALHYDDVPCINGSDSHPGSLETHYENAELYENLPSPEPESRSSSKLSWPPSSSGHYKTPVSSSSASSSSTASAASQKLDKNQPKKINGTVGSAAVKRNNSSVDQYKYGKNRVEADAKRLQAKEDELMKRKQEIRNRLTQLKKDRRDLRTAVENSAEDECKLKEEERVNLELELTEVKESLKKALSGGVTLGLTIEPKTSSSSPQSPVMVRRTVDNSPISSCETSDTETCSLPVNSASLLRRQVPQKNPPILRIKELELTSRRRKHSSVTAGTRFRFQTPLKR